MQHFVPIAAGLLQRGVQIELLVLYFYFVCTCKLDHYRVFTPLLELGRPYFQYILCAAQQDLFDSGVNDLYPLLQVAVVLKVQVVHVLLYCFQFV